MESARGCAEAVERSRALECERAAAASECERLSKAGALECERLSLALATAREEHDVLRDEIVYIYLHRVSFLEVSNCGAYPLRREETGARDARMRRASRARRDRARTAAQGRGLREQRDAARQRRRDHGRSFQKRRSRRGTLLSSANGRDALPPRGEGSERTLCVWKGRGADNSSERPKRIKRTSAPLSTPSRERERERERERVK